MRILNWILVLCLLTAGSITAADRAVLIERQQGNVSIERAGERIQLSKTDQNVPLKAGDTVITGSESKALLKLAAGVQMVMETESRLTVEDEHTVKAIAGEVYVRARKQHLTRARAFTMKTAQAQIAVKGTFFLVAIQNGDTSVYLREGQLSVTAISEPFWRYRKKDDLSFKQYKEEEEKALNAYLEGRKKEYEEFLEKRRKQFREFVQGISMESGGAIRIDNRQLLEFDMPAKVQARFESARQLFASESSWK